MDNRRKCRRAKQCVYIFHKFEGLNVIVLRGYKRLLFPSAEKSSIFFAPAFRRGRVLFPENLAEIHGKRFAAFYRGVEVFRAAFADTDVVFVRAVAYYDYIEIFPECVDVRER